MATQRLEGKVVLITGGSRGVGAACAEACAREGADVAIAAKSLDAHPKLPGTLKEVAQKVEALGRRALPIQVDVRDEGAVEAMVARTVDELGRLDALVNNAGAIHLGSVAEWPTKRFDLVMGVNVRAAFVASKAAIPHLRERGGHIIMMSPPWPKLEAGTGKAPYMVSKLGMTLLAKAIDDEEADVHACALWPVAAIRTAATIVFGLGEERYWRTPDVLADATVALLARDPRKEQFRAWLDEEVLVREGITDLRKYRCDPETEPTALSIQLIDPSWERGYGVRP